MKPRHIDTEVARLEALHQYQIIDTEPEETYDNLAQLAAFICGTPISLVNFIDENRQWFKAKIGLDVSEMPWSVGLSYLCQEQRNVVVVPDTLADEKLASNPVVTGYPYIRFYAGVPLITPQGDMLRTLCAIDQVPRQLSQKQVEAFVGLSRLVIDQLELRRHVSEVSKVTEKLTAHDQATRAQSEAAKTRLALSFTCQQWGGIETRSPENLPPQTGHGELILVVDDEAAIQEITTTSLEAHNYKILVASDGIEAIALYAQNRDKISAVLMDIMLPSLDSLIAMRTLQKINPQVKIIASSGLMSDNKLSALAAIGVNTFLSKPYTVNELLLCLQKVLLGTE